MLSVIHKGRVLDFKYKKLSDYTYSFYIGEILIGQIFKMRKSNWSAVIWHDTDENIRKLFPVDGFKSRYHASEFMLKCSGYA